jgi:hypothetical protein
LSDFRSIEDYFWQNISAQYLGELEFAGISL